MHYDVQRSDPKKSGEEKPARGLSARLGRKRKEPSGEASAREDARTASGAPMLRERMREVLERDRAMAEAQRGAAPQGLAHAPAAELRQTFEPVASSLAQPSVRFEPEPRPEEPVEPKSGTHARLPPEDDELTSLFASWIEEELEVGEVTAVSGQPMAFQSEPFSEHTPEVALEAPAPVTRAREGSMPPPLPKPSARAQPRTKPVPDAAAEPTLQAEPQTESVVLSVFHAPRTGVQRARAGTLAEGAVSSGAAQEPIRTRTMARLLATHGYYTRALSIYDHLLLREPDNAELHAEAELLRSK